MADPPLDSIVSLLALTPTGRDDFVARTRPFGGSGLFGGLLLAQFVSAANCTVAAGREPHSVHAFFLHHGHAGTPIEYHVERVRDGRTFSQRNVTAVQDGRMVANAVVVFHVPGDGDDWQGPALAVPDPDDIAPGGSWIRRRAALDMFEFRHVPGPDGEPSIHPVWIRVTDTLPDDPTVHVALLAMCSDLGLTSAVQRAGVPRDDERCVSVDHAVWFSRFQRADEWFLLDAQAVSRFGGHGCVDAALYGRDGALLLKVSQGNLIRRDAPRRKSASRPDQ